MFAYSKLKVPFACKEDIKGFSLIELMVVMFIAAFLSLIAVPSLSFWVDDARAKSVRQQIYSLASEARSIALKQAQTVTLCYLEENKCQPEFGFPISLFTDNNRNAELDNDEQVIRILSINLPEKISLSWNRSRYMRFWPSGGTGALTGSLSYCDQTNPLSDFRIVVARTGRLRVDEQETRCG